MDEPINQRNMPKKKPAIPPEEIPAPGKHPHPEVFPEEVPEAPVTPEEEPDIIPDDDPFETPPFEIPIPGEGP